MLKFSTWNIDDLENKTPRQAIVDVGAVVGVEDEGDYRRILLGQDGAAHSVKVRESLAEVEKMLGKK